MDKKALIRPIYSQIITINWQNTRNNYLKTLKSNEILANSGGEYLLEKGISTDNIFRDSSIKIGPSLHTVAAKSP